MRKMNFTDKELHQKLKLWPDNVYFASMFDHVEDANVGLAKIAPEQQQQKHYHKQGVDIFIITAGEGILRYGDVCENTGRLLNQESTSVVAGDIYFVDPYQMHCLENISRNQDLMLLNIAPASHGEIDIYLLDD